MNKIIIGCDPDSDKSGFAVYEDGELFYLECMPLIAIYQFIENELNFHSPDAFELHIENLNGNNSSAFNHRAKQSRQVQNKISEGVGKCKHAQTEIEKIAEHFGIKIVHHNVSSKWKNQQGKKEFEQITGWTGKSNEDTRSAAYFGYLGVKGIK